MIRWSANLPAVVGTLGLLLAAVLVWLVTPGWQADQARAEQALQQRMRLLAQRPPPAAAQPPDQRLTQALPQADAAAQRIAALVGAARQHGITLDSVRQAAPLRLGSGPAMLAAERVPLRLAGSAPYSAWRRFVADALQQDDALLLDQLRLSRPGPADRLLVAELQWSLLQRTADAAGPP